MCSYFSTLTTLISQSLSLKLSKIHLTDSRLPPAAILVEPGAQLNISYIIITPTITTISSTATSSTSTTAADISPYPIYSHAFHFFLAFFIIFFLLVSFLALGCCWIHFWWNKFSEKLLSQHRTGLQKIIIIKTCVFSRRTASKLSRKPFGWKRYMQRSFPLEPLLLDPFYYHNNFSSFDQKM